MMSHVYRQGAILITIVAAVSLFIPLQAAHTQGPNEPKSNIVNSKYLTIKDQRFRHESFSDSITGTVVNNSTSGVTSAEVFAALYDKDNHLITVQNGFADVMNLKPAEDSAFKISLFGLGSETIDHYTLLAGGSASP
jgi:hypothetical protein